MQSFDIQKFTELYGAMIPLSILLIENEEDRQFLTEVYLTHRPLMYKVASSFFSGNSAEMDDMIGTTVEKLCKNHETLKGLECNKLRAYIVTTCKRVCISRYRELRRQSSRNCTAEIEAIEDIPSSDYVHAELFTDLTGRETLAAFPELGSREKELILMRHVEQLEYSDIASVFGISEGAIRTAISRAKKKLLKLVEEKKWNGANE